MFYNLDIFWGILIPLLGTSLGSLCVYFLKSSLSRNVSRILTGFAAGVMVAASIWSLIIPALDLAEDMGSWQFIPAVIGFWAGILFLLFLDHVVPHLHIGSDTPEGPSKDLKRTTMLLLAVTIHNIPEGMAVGVIFAGVLAGSSGVSMAGAMVLSLGIAIQNFPEGAIISMPLYEAGYSKAKSFWYGVLSGVVEPVVAILTLLASSIVVPLLPYLLSFAAGAMIYVVVEELIPEMSEGEHSNHGVIAFAFGFTLMMMLDVALG